jgi:4-hydroxy-3-polyprenylbenzoate decarboxylase
MFIVGITGASGILYGIRLLSQLARQEEVCLIVTSKAKLVFAHELGIPYHDKHDLKPYLSALEIKNVRELSNQNLMAPPASGTWSVKAMIVVPATMNTVAAIHAGLSDTLLLRAADVTMKEGRTLILVPRETPFSTIHLKNLMELSQAGVRILPANPGFYHRPKSIDDVVDFIVAKILDQLGVKHTLVKPWDGTSQWND